MSQSGAGVSETTDLGGDADKKKPAAFPRKSGSGFSDLYDTAANRCAERNEILSWRAVARKDLPEARSFRTS